MKLRALFLPAVLSLLLAAPMAAQSPGQKDPQAVAVLTQMASSTGWTQGNIPVDGVATGTATVQRSTGPVTKQIVIKARPGHQMRFEHPAEGTVTVFQGEQGQRISAGVVKQLSPQTNFSTLPLVFLFFTNLGNVAAPDVSVANLGTETIGTETAQRVEIKRTYQVGDGLDVARNRASRMVVSISAASGLPIKIEYAAFADDNPTAVVTMTRFLSDYRQVGSLLVPFHAEEYMGDHLVYALQLDSVQLNAGLPDSDFALQ